MTIAQALISYWRDSLIDAERMGLSGDTFNDPSNYFKVSRTEIEIGQINSVITWQIFNNINQQGQDRDGNEKVLKSTKKEEALGSNLADIEIIANRILNEPLEEVEDIETLANRILNKTLESAEEKSVNQQGQDYDSSGEELILAEKEEFISNNVETIEIFVNQISNDTSEQAEEKSVINILICPVVAVFPPPSNKRKSVVPLWIPAQIELDGNLSINDEAAPWISRKLLEPTEAEFTIGSLETFNNFLVLNDKPTENWSKFWHYCTEMLIDVAGMGCDNFTIDDYTTLPEAFILIDSTIAGSARHIIKVYDWLLEGGFSSNPLIKLYANLGNNRLNPLLTAYQQSKLSCSHLGQMTGKHPLSISQREALYHFFQIGYGDILAINGPPGTGKTTLLQSVVASLWVEKALQQDEPPIILATSTNNQAVTNIIESFGKLDLDSNSSLSRRWLPYINSYGLYLPSKKKVSNFQVADPQGYGFPAIVQNKQYVTEAEAYFLQKCSNFAERPIIILKQAVNFLHQQLVKTFKSLVVSICIDVDTLDIKAQETLDVELRYKAFQLATHYWEGRWLMEMQQIFRQKPDTVFPRVEGLEDRWRRYAMLTPCFVSTFYMAPKFFSQYEDETFTPGLDLIDLLIVDEAGQVTPEVAGATFALAKKALVVGDILQIEPVWSIPEDVDKGNLQKHGLLSLFADKEQLEAEKQEIDDKGLSASAGSVMRIAQHASCYQKYPEQRGMFLSEHRRCVDEIISYCNELCYDGKLEPMRDIATNPSYSPFPCMGHLHIPGRTRQISGSRQNEIEARKIAEWLNFQRQLLEDSYRKSINEIVTPFSKQAELILKELRKLGLKNITVGTVHRLQGAERNIVIFSSVYDSSCQGNFFFDRSVNMLNVAVSRAKDSFLVFGDKKIFNSQNYGTPSMLLAKHLFKNEFNCLSNVVLEQSDRLFNFHESIPATKEGSTQQDKLVIPSSKTYLNVPFSQKDEAKNLGARWDPEKKKWYVPSGKDIQIFSAWLST